MQNFSNATAAGYTCVHTGWSLCKTLQLAHTYAIIYLKLGAGGRTALHDNFQPLTTPSSDSQAPSLHAAT